ncbi:Polysialic acid transport protein KpsD [Saliniradius amylolyticus]|uniref:Polysialic acid transport protein KpsD n=1 Tax=Saliniradius amylolyticus TaxID=2183582 RepID=A0A2S2E0Q9_9ALTE|nr:SLBB domain-containing protein [Saliniradius amylolyticus]AWL11203.1 Polysialic acid transport protein KpsD [Saliniradius amylolyticus]
MSLLRTVTTLLIPLLLISGAANAQTLSQEQMQRFKNMSAQERQRMASQLGIDMSSLGNMNQQGSEAGQGQQQQGMYPRGTQFDQFGNPIESQEDEQEKELEEQEKDKELKLYGAQLFSGEPSTFTPMINAPVPAHYIVGPGDTVNLQLYGKENQEYQLPVNRDGTVKIPQIGPLSVAGMSFSEVKQFLANQIKKQIIGVDVAVTMGELRTIQVFVMGEAYKPGAYNVSSLSTITHALFVSGGVSDIASLRNIQLKRAGKLVNTLDLYDLLNAGDSSDDVLLQSGDVVFIPAVENTVTVDGEVRRPAIYELKNEQDLSEVIALAGGIKPNGYAKAISVKRYKEGVQVQLTGNLSDNNIDVRSGDEIRVPRVSPHVANAVTLIGAVARPGKYQWHSGLRVSSILGDIRSDLLESADLSYVLILREKNANGDLNALQVDLTEITAGQSGSDPLLKQNDRILVFSRNESEAMGDVNLEDLAYTREELDENEKEKWEKRIEEKLFWQQLGLNEDAEDDRYSDEELEALANQTLIELTEAEKESILEFKDATYFSRKRMLAPVIAKLREQARLGEPLQLVEIVGEVKVPGVYPLPVNGSIVDLVKAAGGLTESSYETNSEITRTVLNQDGQADVKHINFNLGKVLAGNQKDIELVSRDRINIFTIPDWQENLTVEVRGEVKFPGEYTIRRGETMTDLLTRVGGLTNYADPKAAIFTREDLKEQEKENLIKLTEELRKQIASESLRKQAGAGEMVSYDEAKKLLRDLTRVEAVGRLVIDLPGIIQGSDEKDVILEDGDTLYVPGESQSVSVIGEVYVPTSHLYSQNVSYEDYINKSGGYKELAAQERTYIIRADGSVVVPGRDGGFWFSGGAGDSQIQPGDTIVVPFDSSHMDNLTLWSSATQIVYQIAVSIAAIGSI